jgi:hypothetical protein
MLSSVLPKRLAVGEQTQKSANKSLPHTVEDE